MRHQRRGAKRATLVFAAERPILNAAAGQGFAFGQAVANRDAKWHFVFAGEFGGADAFAFLAAEAQQQGQRLVVAAMHDAADLRAGEEMHIVGQVEPARPKVDMIRSAAGPIDGDILGRQPRELVSQKHIAARAGEIGIEHIARE